MDLGRVYYNYLYLYPQTIEIEFKFHELKLSVKMINVRLPEFLWLRRKIEINSFKKWYWAFL